MEIKGIAWLGSRTKKFDEMVTFCSEKLGLKQVLTKEGMVVFLMPNGDVFEIMAPQIDVSQPELVELECPKAEFLVEDVHLARQDMEALGIEFVGPVHVAQKHAWTNFRAPDGHLYGLTDDRMPGLRSD